MDLSVIIVSYNVKYFLGLCLNSVYKAAEGTECEIFVVDNNSSDGTCTMVRNEFPKVKLIANTDNRGFAAANNQAIKIASGKYILLLNPDTVIAEDTFRKCISFMDSRPDAGATGIMMINGKGKFLPESRRALPDPETAFYKITGLSHLFPRSARFNRYYLGNISNNITHPADVISGAFMFLRREAVIKTGMLDEKFFMYGEDIDYSFRLIKAGYNNYFYPGAKIIHFKGESTGKGNFDHLINFYNAMHIFVRKHYSDSRMKLMRIPIRIAISARTVLSVLNIFFRNSFMTLSGAFKSLFLHLPGNKHSPSKISTAIVSDPEGFRNITKMLSLAGFDTGLVNRISLNNKNTTVDTPGNKSRISEILKTNGIRHVIFTAGRMNISEIIEIMQNVPDHNIRISIASEGEKYLAGSGSIIIPEK